MHESQQHAFPISAAEAAAATAAVAVAADTSVSDADDRFVGDVGGPTIRSWSYKGNTHWSTFTSHMTQNRLFRRRFLKPISNRRKAHIHQSKEMYYNTTHTRLMALCPGLPKWAGIRKAKPIWILLKQETVSSSGISWAICKSASRCRQLTMQAPHHWVFYRPDALPATQPTASKHWRHYNTK